MQPSSEVPIHPEPRSGRLILGAAMAGALGWGIRGQYGHETGAMIAGVLLSLVLVRQVGARLPAASAFRAVAAGTLGFAFGGSMTYGQTLGLTHDPELVGRLDALAWGMLGLAVKGAIWIGYAGMFIGGALGGWRPGILRVAGGWLAVLATCALGIWILNEPFDPERKVLPALYFSDDWRWEPGAELRPRREVWGGLGLGLVVLLATARWACGQVLPFRLGLWGMLAGGIGFPVGQSLQAFHAWNPGLFADGPGAALDRVMNWWNWMETTFGLVLGGVLGLGLWRNRGWVRSAGAEPSALVPPIEVALLTIHVGLLATAEFGAVPWVDAVYDFGLLLGFLPLLMVTGGRVAPTLLALPIALLPIAGKTIRQVSGDGLSWWAGGLIHGLLPLAVAGWLARGWLRTIRAGAPPGPSLSRALVGMTWVYFGLNFAVFRFPWPWEPWTPRTPNALVFLACAVGLTVVAFPGRSARLPSP